MATLNLHRLERRAEHVALTLVVGAVKWSVLGLLRLDDARRWITGGAR